MIGEVLEGVLVVTLTSLPFLAGARATVDPGDYRYRTSPVRPRLVRALRRSSRPGRAALPLDSPARPGPQSPTGAVRAIPRPPRSSASIVARREP